VLGVDLDEVRIQLLSRPGVHSLLVQIETQGLGHHENGAAGADQRQVV